MMMPNFRCCGTGRKRLTISRHRAGPPHSKTSGGNPAEAEGECSPAWYNLGGVNTVAFARRTGFSVPALIS